MTAEPDGQPDSPTGLVLIADGIGGFGICGRSMRWTVPRQGLPLQVEVIPWGHGLGRWYADLTNRRRHREMAAAIARRAESFKRDQPDAPLFLVGKSGGTGLIVWALEQLPPDSVDRAILIASALSPGYDLSNALRATRHGLVSFYSRLDFLMLGVGTLLFGTIDRVHGPSAGLVGFQPPPGAEALYAEKLHQVKWNPAMIRQLSLGGHFAVDWPPFLKRYVLPWLSPDRQPALSAGQPSP